MIPSFHVVILDQVHPILISLNGGIWTIYRSKRRSCLTPLSTSCSRVFIVSYCTLGKGSYWGWQIKIKMLIAFPFCQLPYNMFSWRAFNLEYSLLLFSLVLLNLSTSIIQLQTIDLVVCHEFADPLISVGLIHAIGFTLSCLNLDQVICVFERVRWCDNPNRLVTQL